MDIQYGSLRCINSIVLMFIPADMKINLTKAASQWQ